MTRLGLRRGLIELRQSLSTPADLFNHCFWPALMLVTLFFMRHRSFAGHPLGELVLPGILGMNASMAMVTMSQGLTADKEDGTLLRMRATPGGLGAYLTGKIVFVSAGLLVDLAIFLVPALLLIPGLATNSVAAWGTVLWVLALGLLATLPLGAVLGTLFGSARGQGVLTLPILGVMGISGIFYPVTALPGWVQGVAQAFPVYWMGLGMRSALLPPGAVAMEIGGSWRHLETVLVLAAWAVAGFLLAAKIGAWPMRRSSSASIARG